MLIFFNQRGQGFIEYGMLIVLIAVIVMIVLGVLGTASATSLAT